MEKGDVKKKDGDIALVEFLESNSNRIIGGVFEQRKMGYICRGLIENAKQGNGVIFFSLKCSEKILDVPEELLHLRKWVRDSVSFVFINSGMLVEDAGKEYLAFKVGGTPCIIYFKSDKEFSQEEMRSLKAT